MNIDDNQRENLELKLYCSTHEETVLQFSTRSKVDHNSAMHATIRIHVHPCRRCEQEMDSIKHSVKTLINFSSK